MNKDINKKITRVNDEIWNATNEKILNEIQHATWSAIGREINRITCWATNDAVIEFFLFNL